MARMALEGVRILDAGTVQAGPWATKLLADMGAEVIRVESRVHLEGVRMGSFPDDPPDALFWEEGAIYHEQHRNKHCITLELDLPQGQEVFQRLVKVSDAVLDSRPPRVMRNFGLAYKSLKEINPGIIMLSSIGYGHGGPFSEYRSYGMPAEGMSSISFYNGYQGGPPRRGTVPYPDHISAMHGAFALLAALEYRRRTGKGQWIDLAHYEVGIHFTPYGQMDYFLNHRLTPRAGNRSPALAPSGCYPCAGIDKWVTIAVSNDEEWQGLCRALGNLGWTQEERFVSFEGRWQHHDEIDGYLREWTKDKDQYAVTHALQKEGVPAGPVLSNKGQLLDPHFKARDFWQWVPHYPEQRAGTRPFHRALWKMSKTPGGVRRPAPLLGQDNEWVLRELAGLSEAEIQDLKDMQVIGTEPENKEMGAARRIDPAARRTRVFEYDENFEEILGIQKPSPNQTSPG